MSIFPKSIIKTVNVLDLMPHPNQPRLEENVDIDELAESINTYGLLNKIKVVAHHGTNDLAGKFFIVAGHRRLKALKKIGLTQIDVEVLERDDPRIPFVDNLQRKDLHLIEMASFISTSIKDGVFLDIKDIASATGSSEKYLKKLQKIGDNTSLKLVKAILSARDFIFSENVDIVLLLSQIENETIAVNLVEEIKEHEKEFGFSKTRIVKTILEHTSAKEDPREEVVEKTEEEIPNDNSESSFLEEDPYEEEFEDIDENKNISVEEHFKTIEDMGVSISYSDDFKIFNIKGDVSKMSQRAAESLISILDKIRMVAK